MSLRQIQASIFVALYNPPLDPPRSNIDADAKAVSLGPLHKLHYKVIAILDHKRGLVGRGVTASRAIYIRSLTQAACHLHSTRSPQTRKHGSREVCLVVVAPVHTLETWTTTVLAGPHGTLSHRALDLHETNTAMRPPLLSHLRQHRVHIARRRCLPTGAGQSCPYLALARHASATVVSDMFKRGHGHRLEQQ